jgi:hypothetical protein
MQMASPWLAFPSLVCHCRPASPCEVASWAAPAARGQAAKRRKGAEESFVQTPPSRHFLTRTPRDLCLFMRSIFKRAANHSLLQPQNSLCHHPRPSCDRPRWGRPGWCGGW